LGVCSELFVEQYCQGVQTYSARQS